MNLGAKFSDSYKVGLVRVTFPIVIKDQFKRQVMAPALLPASDSFENAVRFFDLSLALKKNTYDLFAQAVSFYPADWCLKTFGTGYPPFYVLTGEKCRNKLVAENPVVTGVTNNPQAAAQVLEILRGLGSAEALALVRAGVLVGNNLNLKEQVIKALEER